MCVNEYMLIYGLSTLFMAFEYHLYKPVLVIPLSLSCTEDDLIHYR